MWPLQTHIPSVPILPRGAIACSRNFTPTPASYPLTGTQSSPIRIWNLFIARFQLHLIW